MQDVRYNPALHRIALLTAAATFPLIFMGGLVTSHGAGMSVPDWPNSYGYNMFTFPPSKWVGGIFYEHTHRLMGTVVGMLSIALVITAWRAQLVNVATWLASLITRGRISARRIPSACPRGTRWLCFAVLAAVIFQGVLGGLRVVMVELDLAIVHACFAQAFFCLAALTAVVTSKWWISAADSERHVDLADVHASRKLFVAGVIAVSLVYLQLIVGAVMRHYDAGLAIPDFPLAYGRVLPPTTAEQLVDANTTRAFEMHLPPVTQGQVWLHFGHRIGAVLVSAAIIALVVIALRHFRRRAKWESIAGAFFATMAGLGALGAADVVGSKVGLVPGVATLGAAVVAVLILLAFFRRMGHSRPIVAPTVLLAALLLVQVTLGVLTVLLRKPADIASAHVAVGALTLVTTFVLTVRAGRLNAVANANRKAADTARADFPEFTHDYTPEPVLAA